MLECCSTVIREAPEHTMLVTEVGSYAYGINVETSDHDYSGVFVIPMRRYLSYTGVGSDTIERKMKPDASFHDIAKFCRLAEKGNPSVLDVLWGPVRYNNAWGDELLSLRDNFLHKDTLKPFFGYYQAQVARMRSGHSLHTTGGEWNPKFAGHLLRLMYAARHLAETCSVLVKLQSPALDVVLAARKGEMPAEDVLKLGDELVELARAAERNTKLPQLPNRRAIADFVYRSRMATV